MKTICALGMLFLLFMTAACAGTGLRLRYDVAQLPHDDEIGLAPAGDFSMVTARARMPGDPRRVFCVSPSPDWATALATARSLSASGSVPSGPSASLSASATNNESVSLLAGRTAGVVALRDGLYQACLFYGNGQIGKAASAIILSQYGNALAAVIASGGEASSGNAPTTSSPQIAAMQQAHIQALVVACLNAYDPSLVPAGTTLVDQPVLSIAICKNLLDEIVAKVPILLTPQSASSDKPAAEGDKACGSAVAVPGIRPLVLQSALHASGDFTGRLDGHSSQALTAALSSYQTKNALCVSGILDNATATKLRLARP